MSKMINPQGVPPKDRRYKGYVVEKPLAWRPKDFVKPRPKAAQLSVDYMDLGKNKAGVKKTARTAKIAAPKQGVRYYTTIIDTPPRKGPVSKKYNQTPPRSSRVLRGKI